MTFTPESSIYADSGYTDYTIEDDAKDAEVLPISALDDLSGRGVEAVISDDAKS